MDPAQRRAAASAMAAIARATGLEAGSDADLDVDLDVVIDVDLDGADTAYEPVDPSLDEDFEPIATVDVQPEVETLRDEPVTYSAPTNGRVALAPNERTTASEDIEDWVAAMEAQPVSTPAPRRRRGASRPAGPPVATE
jgi:hypothetical protein